MTTTASGATMISPQGSLTLVPARALRDELHTQIQSGNVRLIVDLSAVDLIDSAGLSALISGLKAARNAGGSLQIAHPSKQVTSILKLTNLHKVLEPYDSAADDSAADDSE